MSSPPVTELLTLPIGPEFSAEKLKQALQLEKAQPGCKDIHWGRTIEDDKVVITFVEWNKIEDHHAFMGAEAGKPFVEALMKLLASPPSFIHIPLDRFPPTCVMKCPVVGVMTFVAKEEISNAREDMLQAGMKMVDLAKKAPKCSGAAIGFAVEDANTLVLIFGWPSRETSQDELQKTQAFLDLVQSIDKFAKSFSFVHVAVQQI